MEHNRLQAFGFAFKGAFELLKTEAAAKIHFCSAIVAICLGIWLDINKTEWMFIAIVIGMCFSAEALNTAIERLTDLVSPGYHPLAGKAKDLASAGVLFCVITSVVIACIIFIPKLITHFG